MEFRKIDINELIPAGYNPRKKLKPGDPEFEKIKNSITEFGYVDPIIVNSDMTIIGGHQRWYVLKALGYSEIGCIVVDLDKTKERGLNLALNKITGTWDMPMLKDLLLELEKADYNIAFTGFDQPEVDEILSDCHSKDVKEDDFDAEKASEEIVTPITRQGDIWLLGRHRLICGDSTSSETYELLMDGKKANLVVTDPPYNVDYEGSAGKIKNDKMDDGKFYEFLLKAFQGMFGAMADGSCIYVFHADRETINFRLAFRDAGFFCHETCVWVKNTPVQGHCDYQYCHEPIIYGWKPTAGHRFYGDRKHRTTWNFDRPTKSPDHPTTKPVALMAYPVQNSSVANCIVLDPFGGSGSTLIACEQTKRICHTIELDEKYCDVITLRYYQNFPNADIFLLRDGVKTKYSDIENNAENARD